MNRVNADYFLVIALILGVFTVADARSKYPRSYKARHAFMKDNPCPSTGKTHGSCPGYVIDHIKPLKRGGTDDPSNMQWQTKEAAKEKDKWE